ncbi:MAG: UvrD-helicase domain-containing protein [Verrucomicrobia bacterium]|nr:UvrD-helicase domain-containing protein [Verrucomicrobiota bacterium]
MAYPDQINPQQREAIEHGDGPLLVVAGAGSGKTRVITYRIAHLISRGTDPRLILGVTFTNKAAGEMCERVERLVGSGRAPLLCTFHSFCARLLRREAPRLGFPNDFTIYDETDCGSVIRRLLKDLGLDRKEYPPSAIKSEIERAKTEMLDPEAYAASRRYGFGRAVAPLYAEYQTRLRRAGAMDFDDLLMYAVAVLRDHPDARDHYRHRFRHVLVDEFQDTNPPQYLLVKLLAAPGPDGLGGNVCVVGDPDQSIYQWRGADIRHINAFETDFPGTRVVLLEQNYRSTPTILRAANAVIGHNTSRHPKALWSKREEGEPVAFRVLHDEHDEAALVAKHVREMTVAGYQRRDLAVLYRTNAQSRLFEETFLAERIPYVVVGTVGFYERREVKDVLAYLRLIVNPADTVSLERIINVPARGIGATTLDRLRAYASKHLLMSHEALAQAGEIDGLGPAARARLSGFHELLQRFRAEAEERSAAEVARFIVDEIGYLTMLKEERDELAPDRIENVEELLDAITAYEQAQAATADEPSSLRGFLENTALIADIDTWDNEHDRVSLMTAHNSKGLEFPVVFVTGLEEGLFPHANSIESTAGIEEERRLFYVALTRAKDRVFLSAADTRMRHGQTNAGQPSRFIDELPEDELDRSSRGGSRTTTKPGLPPMSRSNGDYEPGDRVRHPTFGVGEVLEVTETSCGPLCSVQFGKDDKPRTVAARFARLTRL